MLANCCLGSRVSHPWTKTLAIQILLQPSLQLCQTYGTISTLNCMFWAFIRLKAAVATHGEDTSSVNMVWVGWIGFNVKHFEWLYNFHPLSSLSWLRKRHVSCVSPPKIIVWSSFKKRPVTLWNDVLLAKNTQCDSVVFFYIVDRDV